MIKAMLLDGRIVNGLVDEETGELHHMNWKSGQVVIVPAGRFFLI